jgi:hypothetical protein
MYTRAKGPYNTLNFWANRCLFSIRIFSSFSIKLRLINYKPRSHLTGHTQICLLRHFHLFAKSNGPSAQALAVCNHWVPTSLCCKDLHLSLLGSTSHLEVFLSTNRTSHKKLAFKEVEASGQYQDRFRSLG